MGLNAAHFQQTLVYEREADAGTLLEDLDQISHLDDVAEQQQRKWLIITLTVIGAAGLAAFSFAASDHVPGAVGAAAVGLIAAGFCGFQYRRYRRCNVEDRRYMLASQLLELLRVDMDEDAQIDTYLDLRPVHDRSKLVNKGHVGAWKVKFFEDPWFQLSGRFLDGTGFELTQTDLHQARSKTKRSRSGKLKHKSKTKSAFRAELRLRFKPAKYRHMAALKAEAEEAVQLPSGVELKRLRYNDREIGLRVASKSEWSVRQGSKLLSRGVDGTRALSMMFLSLFQILNLSKAIQKASPTTDTGTGESA